MSEEKGKENVKWRPGDLTLHLCRVVPEAPIYGYAITVDGKTPHIASAGVSPPNHSLIISPEYRSAVTTGFTEDEVERYGYLFAASARMLSAISEIVWMMDAFPHDPNLMITLQVHQKQKLKDAMAMARGEADFAPIPARSEGRAGGGGS